MDQQQCTGLYDIHVEAFGVGRDTGICGSHVYLELCKNLYYNTRKASVCMSVCLFPNYSQAVWPIAFILGVNTNLIPGSNLIYIS